MDGFPKNEQDDSAEGDDVEDLVAAVVLSDHVKIERAED